MNVTDNRMVIHAAHQAEQKEEKGRPRTWQQREYYQVVTVPPGVDAEKIDAGYKNGVLTVTLPRPNKAADGR
jgi:HSP20 family protein